MSEPVPVVELEADEEAPEIEGGFSRRALRWIVGTAVFSFAAAVLLFAGGGLQMGQVIGRSDRIASAPASERYGPANLMATVMHSLLNMGEVRVQSELGRVATILNESQPIPGLL